MKTGMTHSPRVIALALVASLVTIVVAGAFMITCVEQADAAAVPLMVGGVACALHEGHTSVGVVATTAPARSDSTSVPATSGDAPFRLRLGHQFAAPGTPTEPPLAPDPLFGRLLL